MDEPWAMRKYVAVKMIALSPADTTRLACKKKDVWDQILSVVGFSICKLMPKSNFLI